MELTDIAMKKFLNQIHGSLAEKNYSKLEWIKIMRIKIKSLRNQSNAHTFIIKFLI